MNSKSERLKIFVADERDVLELLCTDRLPDAICIGRLCGLPAGAVVRTVHYRYERRAFAFVVEHDSFPEVLPCAELEVVNELNPSLFILKKQADGIYLQTTD